MFRRSPRSVALRIAAVGVVLISAIVVSGDLARIRSRAASFGPEVPVLVASHHLELGAVVDDDDVVVRRVHRSQLPRSVVGSVTVARGRTVAVPVVRGSFVTQANLAPRRPGGIAGLIPPGMRAFRVAVPGSLRPRPGAVVDLLATFVTGSDSEAVTIVVAAGVIVIGTDGDDRDQDLGITVLVGAAEVERLADAAAAAVVSVALAPPEAADGSR